MKKKVALIYGGNSSEIEISILSGKHVAANIDKSKYEVYEILLRGADWSLCSSDTDKPLPMAQIDKTDFSCTLDGVNIKFDVAFIMIHGTPGENGLLQGYFEMMGIPFTTCSSYVSALTFDKYSCKTFLRDTGVKMAREVYLRKGDKYDTKEIITKLGLPLFVKPSDGGSSFGITKVKKEEDLAKAISEAFSEGETVLVEEFISGREMTEGVFSSKGEIIALPVTEIIPHNEFFDYEAKYLGKSDEVCPASISADTAARIEAQTRKIYHHFGCKGLVRMDYILHGEDIYFLEINTVPGMTKMSLVPQQVRVAGIDMTEFFTTLLEEV
ncbi:MAG: D-alanine--D-alanine ligase [Bacteroidales bacterium]|nr:D-alanine--D-alanine ligase [Bacteroidales bacterium]MDD4670098.1 D-alanine--D-alanine ligase [Bacteroidales bacterium]